ncbi:protein croquemort-like [Phymastichus coffea]|uniref:protein croquemort-like n=1 Tax=Phymastichus coffea TaxID=108790 RepID=UPI00273BE5F5|nr:protein croquemort-like [Phymastichus coffea]XP_058803576.1 protein croquemort-like [Phymastichus coffea]
MRPWTSRTIVLGSIGLTLLLVGAAVYLLRNILFHAVIRSALTLSPNSGSYKLWEDTESMQTHMDIYFFNWTNPDDLMDPTKKPILVELGPYSFRERRQKVNVTFHPENSTVSYLQKRTWLFDSSRSNGSLEDKILQLNVVAVSAAHKIRYWQTMIQQSLSYLLNQFSNKIYIVKTVDELLFTGFEDKIITMGKMSGLDEDSPPFDKFGWFYMRNGSTDFDGYSNVATGEDDISKLGSLMNWNYKDTTKFFSTPCNVIEGSAGEFWPPYRNKDDIRLFTPDICRPVTFEYEQTVTNKGIEGYKFSMGKTTLSNNTRRQYPHEQAKYFTPTTTTEDFFNADLTTVRPENENEDPDVVNEGQCFCNGECSPSGIINVTSCRYGAPGFISLPHFHKGDPVLRDQFIGLNPKEESHSFYLTLEPTTGIPIDVAARLQINILMQPSKTVALFKDVPTLYFPMFWFDVRAGIPDDMVDSFKILLNLPNILMYIGLVFMFVGSLVLFCVAIMGYISNRRRLLQIKADKSDTLGKKTEMVYMDKTGVSEDAQTRADRRLFPYPKI